jgi:hypothetical protein
MDFYPDDTDQSPIDARAEQLQSLRVTEVRDRQASRDQEPIDFRAAFDDAVRWPRLPIPDVDRGTRSGPQPARRLIHVNSLSDRWAQHTLDTA